MHTTKATRELVAIWALFLMLAGILIAVDRAVVRELSATDVYEVPVKNSADDEELEETEFDVEMVIAREFENLRAERHSAGRQIYAVGLVIKTFGKPLPIPVVNSFANSLGSQLMVQGLLLCEQISQNPAIAFGQGFLVGM